MRLPEAIQGPRCRCGGQTEVYKNEAGMMMVVCLQCRRHEALKDSWVSRQDEETKTAIRRMHDAE